ncbi:MAG: chemotaxis protein CheX [bacterium]|nr:chemotaxis protein CheX [bacterium]
MTDTMTEAQETVILPEDVISRVFDSVSETYGSMCECTPEKVECPPEVWLQDAVVGIISLVGPLPLTMLLHFPKDTAVKFSEAFAGMEFEFESADMNDLIGELANIIAGDTKARLEEVNMITALSLPTVVKGMHVQIAFRDQVVIEEVNFKTAQGHFQVRLAAAKQLEKFSTLMPGR